MILLQFVAVVGLLSVLGIVLIGPFSAKLPDRGLGFAPTVGLVAVTLPMFWLAHIPGIKAGAPLSWVIYTVVLSGILYIYKKKAFWLGSIRIPKAYIVAHTLTWFILYFAYLFLRRYSPDIFGIEKLPDFAFLNSIFTYGALPPENLFVSDQIVNYYYFGFFNAATFAWMGLLKANEVVNSMAGYVLATTSTTILSTGIYFIREFLPDIKQRKQIWLGIGAGIIGIIFAFLLGNAHSFYYTFIVPREHFWYPDATRFIANTIHEFPLYSYLIGDLHAHLLDLPNTVLAPLLIYLFAKKLSGLDSNLWTFLKRNAFHISALCISFGLSYATNSWNIFTNLMLIGFATWFSIGRNGMLRLSTLIPTGLLSILYVSGSALALLPFWIYFSPMTDGVQMTPAEQSSPSIQLLIIWVVHLLIPSVWLWLDRNSSGPARFLRLWIWLGIGFIFFMEFFYFKDIYAGHLRANTMFKIGLQVWLWMSMITGIATVVLFAQAQTIFAKSRVIALAAGAIIVGATFTLRAVPQYVDSVKGNAGNLDGIDFIRKRTPELMAMLRWMKGNIDSRKVVLSGVADSFSEGGVLNAFAAQPTLVTWFNHVWLWNGTPEKQMKPKSKIAKTQGVDDTLNTRRLDVATVYTSPSLYDTKQVIRKYGIKYVLISPVERRLYPNLNQQKFDEIGSEAFKLGNFVLYEVGAD